MYRVEKDWFTKAGLRAVVTVCTYNGKDSHRCGYVGVGEGSVLFGKDYQEHIPEWAKFEKEATLGQKSPILAFTAGVDAPDGMVHKTSPELMLDCHGGITFSSSKKQETYPGESNLWWFGFDCNHFEDGTIEPSSLSFGREHFPAKSLDFCVEQCESLAQQIVTLAQRS